MRSWLVGYASSTLRLEDEPSLGVLHFQSVHGGVPTSSHPGGVEITGSPMWPPLDSEWQLAPDAVGGFSYFSEAIGAVSWEPPKGSTVTPLAALPRLPFCDPPRHSSSTVASPPEPWAARYCGDEVHYLNLRTGALRNGPWIVLQEPVSGKPYAFDPSSGDARWTPPSGWMEGWKRGPQASSREISTPRERITVAEARLEIGGGAQWGVGVAPWDDFTDVESRAIAHLYSSYPHLCDETAISWKEWQAIFIHTFRVFERVIDAGSGVRDHALVRAYEQSNGLVASSHAQVSECIGIVQSVVGIKKAPH